MAKKIDNLFQPYPDRPYPGGIRHVVYRGKTYAKRDIYKIYYVYTDYYVTAVNRIVNIIQTFNVRRSQIRKDEEKSSKSQNRPFNWNRLYALYKDMLEKYARRVEDELKTLGLTREDAILFVPLLYNYQDPVYKDIKFTPEEDENIVVKETEEVKKGSGYRRRSRRTRRTKRTTRTRKTRRTRRTRKRR
jgi:hypothetical protein